MPKERCTHSFNALLSDRHVEALEQLQEIRGTSKGQIIRDLITKAHATQVLHAQFCASGDRCLVPHLFTQAPPPAA